MAGQGTDTWRPSPRTASTTDPPDPRDADARTRRHDEARARSAARRKALRSWFDARGLTPLAWAAAAGGATTALFAVASLLRAPCDAQACPAYAGVPAAVLESAGIATLLAGLASAGVWIAHLTQRTWTERLRLRRTELELAETKDTARLRRLDAVLQEDVAGIHAQARLYFWSGLPTALVATVMLPASIGIFAQHGHLAAYMLPVTLLGVVAGTAAAMRGLALGMAARRLTRPLREQPERAPRTGKRDKAAKA